MSENLKKIRTVSKSRFTRTRKSLLHAVRQNVLQETVKSRYTQFKAVWEDVQRCHEEYVGTLEEPDVGRLDR